MAMNPVVWAYQPIKQLKGRLGYVEVEQGQAYADKLIKAGHVQSAYIGSNPLKHRDPTLPEVDFPENPPAGGGGGGTPNATQPAGGTTTTPKTARRRSTKTK